MPKKKRALLASRLPNLDLSLTRSGVLFNVASSKVSAPGKPGSSSTCSASSRDGCEPPLTATETAKPVVGLLKVINSRPRL